MADHQACYHRLRCLGRREERQSKQGQERPVLDWFLKISGHYQRSQ